MASQKKSRPDPSTQGKGQIDEVDQSKGVFPPGVPHPEGAELRYPGSIGGGPYEESGRGGIGVLGGRQSSSRTSPKDSEPVAAERTDDEEPQAERPEDEEKKPGGVLPPHKQGAA